MTLRSQAVGFRKPGPEHNRPRPNGFELSGAGRPTNPLNDNEREPPDGVRLSEVLGDAFT